MVHLIRDELMTECGLAWAINYIGAIRKANMTHAHNVCAECLQRLSAREEARFLAVAEHGRENYR